MHDSKRRLLQSAVLTAVILWLVTCRFLSPQVPGREDEVISNLQGLLVMQCTESEAWICAIDLPAGRRVHVVTPDCEANCLEPSLSPDGEKIAFTEGTAEGADVWLADAHGGDSRPVVESEEVERDPTWSPDGQLIAYRTLLEPYTLPGGTLQAHRSSALHIVRSDGTGGERLTREDGYVLAFDWGPRSDRLIVSARLEDLNQDGVLGDGDRTRLYVVDLLTREVQPIFDDVDSRLSMHEPSWSPDGACIAFIEGHGDPVSYGDLVVMKVDDGSEVARLDIGPGATYSWSPTGNEIAYVEFRVPSRVGYEDLFVFDLSTGDVTRVTDTSQYSVFSADELNGINLDHVAWSPDGEYLAFVWRTEGKDYIVVASADGSQLSRLVALGAGYHHLTAWGPR